MEGRGDRPGIEWDRRDRQDGYTLIEMMVVVLVVGILLSIALPTFLGARERAQNRGAQAGLRNALVAGKSYYTDGATYTDFDLAAAAMEPSLTYVPDIASLVQDGGKTVAIVQSSGDQLLLVSWSQSGSYFGLAD